MSDANFESVPLPKDVITDEPSKSIPLFRPKDQFNLDRAIEHGKIVPIERQISPYEKGYTIGNFSYVVWTEGPKTGYVYRTVEAPSQERLADLPKAEDIQARITKTLQRKSELAPETAGRELADLEIWLHKLYYGSSDTAGLEEAQLFDLQGEGQKYLDFLATINPPTGIGLRNLFSEKEEEAKKDYRKSNYHREVIIRGAQGGALCDYLYSESTARNPHFRSRDPEHPILLTHFTYGNILTNVIQMEGLAAKTYFESHGVRKRFGGEYGTEEAATPDYVSFYNTHYGDIALGGTVITTKHGLEYPMVFGIDDEHAEGLEHKRQGMSGEERVRGFVPMNRISHLFVPDFKVPDVRTIFAQHGFDHIKILPFQNEETSSPDQ